ncbi:MAG TPA: peptide MFS transporter [Gammaproteobacteria bacterium]|jgi:POT family proton-dependent oligopeptide transporter|nr:peptide MFS transporter [Xanthomonadales bacterium]MCB1594617.1 peptide MFS transporter [Xanthomonadales bacterium]HOP21452.1 peptide MFS transporter [Gammaproteobacteria bacterium]HPI94638.1 peptide MFS transporter [Gammaproteobacteria bacterium]HPQ86083.1 peptide MFS transporter [Gammaproteobacteria bacterium]
MTTETTAENAFDKGDLLWGHPKGLYVCFATELWERFSFYGMKFLLLLYLTKYHLFSDVGGLEVVGSYAGLVYALPLIGGLLADRYLGMRKAVLFGGVLLVMGHLLMAVEGTQASMVNGEVVRDQFAINVFYLALSLIVVGVGFLKPNISTIVGQLYPENDPRRDSGFTIFYQGINIGSFVATIICAWLGETYGWSYGFGAAGMGMLIGLVTFMWGQKYLYGHAEPHDPAILKQSFLGPINKEWGIYIVSILSLGVVWLLVQKIAVVFFTQNIFLVGSIVGLVFYSMFYKNNNHDQGLAKIFMAILLVLGLITMLSVTTDHFPNSIFGTVGVFNTFAEYMVPLAWVLFGAVVGFIIYGFMMTNHEEYSRMVVLIILITSTIVFWALFEQSAGSMTLFADRVVDRKIINSSFGSADVWIFYLVGGVFILLSALGLLSANKHRKLHNTGMKPIVLPIVIVGGLIAALGLGKLAYGSGMTWIGHLSYLGIFILLLVAVIVAISLAFILIGFFFEKDKTNTVTAVDSSTSSASLGVLSTTLLFLGAGIIYYGVSSFGSLPEGELKPLVFEPTAGQFGSLNALFIFTLAPVFAALWIKLGKRNMDPSTPVKFSLGLIQVGLGFGALLLGAMFPGESGKVAWLWLALAYLIHTTAELSLSPVGLSAVTKLSIKSVVSMVMGVWFLATALSEVVAALLAKIAALDTEELNTLTVVEQLDKYNELWMTLIYLGVGLGLFMLIISPFLKKGMKGIH